MDNRSLHQSLKSEVVKQVQSRNAKIVLVKLQWGKNDIGFSLHVSPNTFSTAGIQVTDFLNYLCFERDECLFTDDRQCYARLVGDDFDAEKFSDLFDQAFSNLVEAQKDLGKCGLFFDQPEGWGYYYGKHSRGIFHKDDVGMDGDGHTASGSEIMKNTEDNNFRFIFTWIKNNEQDKGWVIHYLPKHLPLSSELQSVFKFLGINNFSQCPHFDFEPCYWRSIKFISRGDDFLDGNADVAHGWFDAHANYFSSGIEKLLTANAEIEKAGLQFLPFPKPSERLGADIEKKIERPEVLGKITDPSNFDVAISFAGPDRSYAEKLANILKKAGFSVFYDEFYPEYLWGKNLIDTFDQIFRKRSRYCVIFVSKDYKERVWTNHERQSAQARALNEKGNEYILPIQIDNTELDGVPPIISYVPINKGMDKIGELLIKKLSSSLIIK